MQIFYKKISEKILEAKKAAEKQCMEIDYIELNQCEWHSLKNECKAVSGFQGVNGINSFYGIKIVVTKD